MKTSDEATAIPISTFRTWADEKDLARENESGRRKTRHTSIMLENQPSKQNASGRRVINSVKCDWQTKQGTD